MEEKAKQVLSKLEAQCSRREYCRADILKKALERMNGDRDAAEEIVASLEADNFVSDLRYASAFAREKASLTGWGPVKISFALKGKGIDAATVAGALAAVDPEKSGDKLRSILESKYRMLKGCGDVRLKLLKFALSRGYDYDTVKKLV